MAFAGREDIIGVDEILYDAAELVLPDTLGTGLEALHFMGGGLAAALRNWAAGKPDATAVGTPAERADSLSMTANAAFLQGGVPETAAGTLIAVGRGTGVMNNAATTPLFISSYTDPTSRQGASLFPATQTNVRGGATFVANSAYAQAFAAPAAAATSWLALAADFDDTGGQLRNLTANTTTPFSAPASGAVRALSGSAYRYGSALHPQFGGTCDLAFVALWSRRLSSTEVSTFYAWLKRAMATEGLAI